jgi:hypothetical protein
LQESSAFPAIVPASISLIRNRTAKQVALNDALGAAVASLGLAGSWGRDVDIRPGGALDCPGTPARPNTSQVDSQNLKDHLRGFHWLKYRHLHSAE